MTVPEEHACSVVQEPISRRVQDDSSVFNGYHPPAPLLTATNCPDYTSLGLARQAQFSTRDKQVRQSSSFISCLPTVSTKVFATITYGSLL